MEEDGDKTTYFGLNYIAYKDGTFVRWRNLTKARLLGYRYHGVEEKQQAKILCQLQKIGNGMGQCVIMRNYELEKEWREWGYLKHNHHVFTLRAVIPAMDSNLAVKHIENRLPFAGMNGRPQNVAGEAQACPGGFCDI